MRRGDQGLLDEDGQKPSAGILSRHGWKPRDEMLDVRVEERKEEQAARAENAH